MKAKDLQNMSAQELQEKLLEVSKELMNANAQIASGTTPKSPGQVRQLKKTIARIRTLQHQKEKEKVKQHE